MNRGKISKRLVPLSCLALFLLAVPRVWAQGPPYQTDDPVPVDYGHYEFYIFGGIDGTPVEMDTTGPAIEFNWGALPRVQLHAIVPLGSIMPSNNAAYLPGGTGPSAFGIIDAETGIKLAWIKETKYFPQIGSFTMFELPTGSYSKGLGVGTVWYKVPIWAQKNIGPWCLDAAGVRPSFRKLCTVISRTVRFSSSATSSTTSSSLEWKFSLTAPKVTPLLKFVARR